MSLEYQQAFKKILVLLFIIPFCIFPFNKVLSGEVTAETVVAYYIQQKLEKGDRIAGSLPYSHSALKRFYADQGYQPLWSQEGALKSHASQLVNAIAKADQEGLNPSDYHLATLQSLLSKIKTQKQKKVTPLADLAKLDLLLTDSFLVYGSHLLAGHMDPESNNLIWFNARYQNTLFKTLQKSLSTKYLSFNSLLPQRPEYEHLKKALASYLKIVSDGGWNKIEEGEKLEPNFFSPRTKQVRDRLFVENYIKEYDKDTQQEEKESKKNEKNEKNKNPINFYDEKLVEAVKKYQSQNGLQIDGVVGQQTLNSLNVSAAFRACQITINLDRIRSFEKFQEKRYIIVNIPDFHLDVIENDKSILNMKTIVGRKERPSPILSNRITYMVFSPKWTVPQTIAVEDTLPLIKNDITYLASHNMKIFEGTDKYLKEVDPTSINWSEVTAENFDYQIIQDPGTGNPLGTMKFMFPNKHSVYMHDTSNRLLFDESIRALSSGCIRVEKPFELAEYVLKENKEWGREAIENAIKDKNEYFVDIPKPLPIHLVYRTAWSDTESIPIQFRNDLYGIDQKASKSLCKNIDFKQDSKLEKKSDTSSIEAKNVKTDDPNMTLNQ